MRPFARRPSRTAAFHRIPVLQIPVLALGPSEAKTQLSALLRRVAAGEEITIARAGKPIARLVPLEGGWPTRELGFARGVRIPRDFDAPLPAEILRAFHGGADPR